MDNVHQPAEAVRGFLSPDIAAALDRAVDGLLRNGPVTADDDYLLIS